MAIPTDTTRDFHTSTSTPSQQVQEVSQTLGMCLFSAGWSVLEGHKDALLKAFADEYASSEV